MPRLGHKAQSHDHAHSVPLRALAIGMMHGMAGSAALVLLSVEAVHSFAMGLATIALFGLGSIAGMALLSIAIALPLRLSAGANLAWIHNGLTASVGVFSCVLGVHMAVRAGSTSGLFA